jgi:hypothetical protein
MEQEIRLWKEGPVGDTKGRGRQTENSQIGSFPLEVAAKLK